MIPGRYYFAQAFSSCLFFFCGSFLFAQTATFRADSTFLWYNVGQNRDNYERAMEMEWKIRGQTIHFGSAPVKIIPDANRIDTVFYHQHAKAKWDTFICIIKKPLHYKFIYNECCDAFYVEKDSSRSFLRGSVIFKMTQKPADKIYLGTLGEGGILIKSLSTDTLFPICTSPMSPDIYTVSFREIKICKDTTNCREGTCLFVKDGADPDFDFGFKTISTKTEFLFMPLGEPLIVIFDAKSGKIILR